MLKRRSLWTLVLPFALVLGSSVSAFAQDEPPPEGGDTGTPPAGGDTGTPPEGGDTGTPPAGGDTGTPPAGGDTGAAAAGGDMGMGMTEGVYTKATWPLEFTKRPITLAKGMVEIRGDIGINLSKGAVGKPFQITPAVYYGVSDKLSVGLNNDTLCLSGTSGGCFKAFNSIGIDAIFAFMQGKNNVGAHGGIQIPNFADPPGLFADLQVGVLARLLFGKVAVVADPAIRIGLTKRSLGNKESLSVPVALWFQATPKLAAGIDTGIGGPLSHFGDFYSVPLGIDALFAVSNKLDVGLRFAFPNIGGKGHTADARAIDLLVNFRL